MSPRARLLAGTVLALLLGALGVGLLFLRARGPAGSASVEQGEAQIPAQPGSATAPRTARPADAAARPGTSAGSVVSNPASSSRPAATGAAAGARQAELLETIRRGRPQEGLPEAAASRDGGAALGAEEIRGAIRALQPKIHECYASRLKEQEGLRGTLTAKFTIVAKDGKGMIDEGEVKSSTLGDLRLETCMLHALTTARFPMPRGQGRVVVTYPFRFAPR